MENESKESIISEYNVEEVDDYLAIQSLQLLDEDYNLVATHKVYAINSSYVLNEMKDSHPPTENLEQHPIYMCQIDSHIKQRGIGLKLWKYGETVLYSRSSKPYYRLVKDISDNGWSRRHSPEFIEYLREQNINVEVVSEKYYENEDYNCLLLIGKDENSTQYT